MSSRPFNIFVSALTGLVGGLLAGVFVLPMLAEHQIVNLASIWGQVGSSSQQVITRVEEKIVTLPGQDKFVETAKKVASSVVGIQSFASGRLIRSGSGIVLTQDGLAVTLASLVPPEANFVQTVINGEIYQAKVVWRDYRSNIAIISVPVSGLPVARLKTDAPLLGQSLMVLGKTITFSKDNPLIAGSLVSQVNEVGGTFTIAMDFNAQLYGGALVENGGDVLGLVNFISQKPTIVFIDQIKSALEAYLVKIK
ncbi:MAG: trypsin-like peptidase domain-containing protein [Candidatus Yanofskybacteria bacterium]|nr:trypsin-like peptidase domain-containing protein [Candidatus Yanofskybacteria bacterium]